MGCRDREISSLAVALIFVNPQQILPTDVHTLDGKAFKNLQLPVSRENCNQITDIIARLNQENGQTRMTNGKCLPEDRFSGTVVFEYHWMLATHDLACFMCKMVFDDKLKRDNGCDNCIYKNAEERQMLGFDGYNIMARLSIIYEHTIEYSNLLLSSKRDRLLAVNLIRNSRIMVEQTLVCKTALNNFV